MTENHRAEGRVESIRLRRMMGTSVFTDSFGDARCVNWSPLKQLGSYKCEDGWVLLKIHGGA